MLELLLRRPQARGFVSSEAGALVSALADFGPVFFQMRDARADACMSPRWEQRGVPRGCGSAAGVSNTAGGA